MRNLGNFHQSTWKSQNWDFDGILLSKVQNVPASNLQGSYLSRQGKKMQNLKRNWLVVSKLIWGFWWILTRALENLKSLHFNGLPLTKVYDGRNCGLCLMELNIGVKLEGKVTCAFKNDIRDLGNFHQSTWESPNWDFDGILLSKAENLWAPNLRGSYLSWQWRMMEN